ncbi:cytidylate kinase [Candidatus Beckwithbacteria bacterium RBG_13_42_9]|uniref:Cytidylate kinase n=1 Tax=Candidatus Beckwithbacteria bacterium RBG_13_42_9 TaxID=1797457 RepID=A0A1F5E8X0_9BACT|nr:MAG: cytidylate kinase [Candidatus Beckwithbacteria bacterium RBG_13_42_9]
MGKLLIAIDGPVAAGKGVVSKLLAQKLGILYVDTGAMYRAVTLFVKRHGINWENEAEICQLLQREKPTVELQMPEVNDGRLVTVLLNGEDISWAIRTEEISWGVSVVTRYRCVRDYMLPQQRQLAQKQSVVMEGRDITTRVLPNASLKIYMDADEKVRIQRRFQELIKRGEKTTLRGVREFLKKRDQQDKQRANDPLTIVVDAWVLDTTELSINQVVEMIINKIREKKLQVY